MHLVKTTNSCRGMNNGMQSLHRSKRSNRSIHTPRQAQNAKEGIKKKEKAKLRAAYPIDKHFVHVRSGDGPELCNINLATHSTA